MVEFTRRSLVRGFAAMGAAAALPSAARFAGAATRNGANPCRLILVSVGGGWDISYALDPKPGIPTVDAPEGSIEDFSGLPIFVHESREPVTRFFEAWADRSALVHGLGMRSISHITCGQKIFTGYASTRRPDAGAILGHELGGELPLPYLVLGDVGFSGPLGASTGRVGSINQINALLPPGDFFPPPPRFQHGGFAPTAEDEALIAAFVDARASREQDTRGARGYNQARVRDYRDSLIKADLIRDRADRFGDFGLNYGLPEQADFAVRALREDLAWSVGLSARGDWDTHGDNSAQAFLHNDLYTGLSQLAEQLATTPGSSGKTLLDETLVVVSSEMSRTPLLNASGGKDHWSTTSVLMFGGPVRGGRMWGASNDLVEPELINTESGELDPNGQLLEPANLLAGIVASLGGDPESHFPNAEPFRAPFA